MSLAGHETCPSEEMEAALAPQGVRSSTVGEVISEEQHQVLKNAVARIGASESRFCAYFKVRALEELPAVRFKAAKEALDRKGKTTSKEEAR